MIGTSAAFLVPKVATIFTGSPFDQMARAAGCVAAGCVLLGFILGLLLPEPKEQVAD
jgi:hypothetical protein